MRRICLFTAVLAAILIVAADSGAQQPAKGKTDPKAKVDPKAKAPPAFNMKITTADIILGSHVMGPTVDPKGYKGHAVFFDQWGVSCAPCLRAMPHASEVYSELADYGLVMIGAHAQEGNADQVRAVATSHGATFPIYVNAFVRGSEDNRFLPHCMLFDHTGACVFRGQPTEVESALRKAVGNALVAAADRAKFTSTFDPIVKELKSGKSPASLLPRVAAMRNFKGEAGEDAKALLAAMTAVGTKKLEQAEAVKDTDSVEAFTLIEKVPAAFKGAPVAHEASALLTKLRGEKAVRSELAARQYFDSVKRLDQQLGFGAEDPRKPEFQKSHAPILEQFKKRVQQMKKAWPDAHVTKDALAMAERYMVEIK